MMEPATANLADEGVHVQRPVHQARVRRARRARRRPARRDRGGRTGRPAQVDGGSAARDAGRRGRRRAGPRRHVVPPRAAARSRWRAGSASTRSLAAIARPTLSDLAEASGEAAGLGVPDGDLVHYIDQVDTPHPVLVRDWTGVRAPLHAVSSGQVLLAFRTPAAIERYLERPAGALHAEHARRSRCGPRAAARRPSAAATPGRSRSSTRGSRRWRRRSPTASGEVIAAVHIHGPSYRFPPSCSDGRARPARRRRRRQDRRGAARGLTRPCLPAQAPGGSVLAGTRTVRS